LDVAVNSDFPMAACIRAIRRYPTSFIFLLTHWSRIATRLPPSYAAHLHFFT
jgi:hypothetical protein